MGKVYLAVRRNSKRAMQSRFLVAWLLGMTNLSFGARCWTSLLDSESFPFFIALGGAFGKIQPVPDGVLEDLAIDFVVGFGEGNALGAHFDAIHGVVAILNSAGAHHGFEAFARMHRASGMHVEEAHLIDDGGADELRVIVYLGANFEAIAAGDAARHGVADLLLLGRHARAGSDGVRAVDGYPALHALQIFEHDGAVHLQIADQREFRERLEANRLFEIVDERGAGLTRIAVDEHGAGAADFFKAIRVIGNRRGAAPRARDGFFGDVAQAGDDVEMRAVANFEFFPDDALLRSGLAFDAEDECFVGHRASIQAATSILHLVKQILPQGLKPLFTRHISARLKPCPDASLILARAGRG